MYVQSSLVAWITIASAVLGACGGDEESGPPPRCPGVLDDGSDDPSADGPFDAPADFDRGGCGDGGALEDVDVCGIWNLDMEQEGYQFPGSVRVDADDQDDLAGLLYGRDASDVRHTRDDLFLRMIEERPDGEGGTVEVTRTLDACEVREDGVLAGRYASCWGEECNEGTFTAHKVEPLEEPAAEGLTLLGEWNGPPDDPWPGPDEAVTLNVRHLGDTAYVTRHDGLHIVDVADPAHPSELGSVPVTFPDDGEYWNDLKIVEANDHVYALMGSSLRGVVVIDVTDGSAPEEVTSFPQIVDGAVNVHTLFVEGDRVYFANYGVDVWDISDPLSAEFLGSYVHPLESFNGVHDLYVEDSVVYLNNWDLGMVVVDLSDPAAPELVGVFDDYERRTSHSNWVTEAGGRRVSVHGDEDFGAHVRIVDTDGLDEIGAYQTRPEVSVHNILADDGLAYVTYYQDGLRVLDLADPTEPVEIAHFQTWPGPDPGYGQSFYEGAIGIDLDVEKGLLFLADTHRGLLILELDR